MQRSISSSLIRESKSSKNFLQTGYSGGSDNAVDTQIPTVIAKFTIIYKKFETNSSFHVK